MLKEEYPIILDDLTLTINHRQWARTYNKVTTTNQTEDGHDDVEIIRAEKNTIRAQFRCTDEWASKLVELNSKAALNVQIYDVFSKSYQTYVMRMDGLSVTEVPKSDRLSATNGVYDVSFSLVEY